MTSKSTNLGGQKVLCVLVAGLGNRLKCLISAIILSRDLACPLDVFWTDVDVGKTQLTDLMEKPYPFNLLSSLPKEVKIPTTYQALTQWEDESIASWRHAFIFPLSRCLANGVALFPSEHLKDQLIVVTGWWEFMHPQRDIQSFKKLKKHIILKEFRFTQPVRDFLAQYLNHINENTIGVHLRGTDFCKVWGNREDDKNRCSQVHEQTIDRIAKLMKNSETSMFICTDDAAYRQQVQKTYQNRVFIVDNKHDRYCKEGQQESLAQLLALSKCPRLLLVLGSTFSGEVSDIADLDGDSCQLMTPDGPIPCRDNTSYAIEAISLPQRVEGISNMLTEVGTSFNIFNAIIGKDLDVSTLTNYFVIPTKLVPGEIGCMMSHVKILEKYANNTNNDIVIIFEDDTTISPYYINPRYSMLEHISDINLIDPNWDLFYFGRCYDKCLESKFFTPFPQIIRVAKPACLHAYAVKIKSIPDILRRILPSKKAIDGAYADLINQGILRAYASNPPIFYQKGIPTSIVGRKFSAPSKLPTCEDCSLDRLAPNNIHSQKIKRFIMQLLIVVNIVLVFLAIFLFYRRRKER